MALNLCSGRRKVNWLIIYENQCSMAGKPTAKSLLIRDSMIKGQTR